MPSQIILRDAFIKKHPTIRYGLGEWRQYESGVWQAIADKVVKNYIQTIIQKYPAFSLSSQLVNSVAELVSQRSLIIDRLFDANPNIIVFNNLCLDLTTFETVPHSPEHFATNRLSFDYDPDARSSAWEKASQTFPHREFLQDFAGLCLTPETKYEIAVWLHGPPGGGKSTFIVGLEAMLGPKCCTLGLNEISNSTFGLSQIPGRTLAVSTEQPAAYVRCASILNSLISGESTTINRKYREAFTVTPHLKMLWAMNELPFIPAGSGAGLFRRVYPVYWPTMPESERNPEVKEEITHSGMAVVNWALEGLKRVRARKGFDIPAELLEAREHYRTQSDVTLCFLEDCYDRTDGESVSASTLYATYRKWCESNGHKGVLANNRFAADLDRIGISKIKRSAGVFYEGLSEKADPEMVVSEADH